MLWGADMFIAQKTNIPDGVTVQVTQASPLRYSVLMRDDDSGNWLPHARVYSDRQKALEYANEILPQGEWSFLVK